MIAASIGNTHHFDEDEVFIRLPRRIAGRGGLFAAWRLCAPIIFFSLAKAQRPACGRQTQRNCGALGLTSGGFAAWRLCAQFFFLFSQRCRDLPAVGRRKEIVVH